MKLVEDVLGALNRAYNEPENTGTQLDLILEKIAAGRAVDFSEKN